MMRFKASIIDDQGSDDLGVYEVWWSANTRWPALPLSTRLAAAERAVRELLDEGRVSLVKRPWVDSTAHDEAVSDVGATLLAWSTWAPDNQWCGW